LADLNPKAIKGGIGIKTYSPGELKFLVAEGRLKGNGISSLVNLRQGKSRADQPVSRSIFSRYASRTPCWTDPIRLLDTFLDLAQTYSPSGQESRVADYVQARLDRIGFETNRDPVGNLIGILVPNSTTAPNLMFTAHMDCIYPGNEAPVKPIFYRSGDMGTDGRNSLGADDKSGIAGILATLEYIVKGRLPHGEIKAVFTVQEEIGWRGIKQIPGSILNGIHLALAMDPPVRVEKDETGFMAVLHVSPGHPFVKLARSSARRVAGQPLLLYSDDGYVGGDTICISPLGAIVIDFCSGSRYSHTTHEHLRFADLARQTSWMIATTEEVLACDRRDLEVRAVYGDEPIGRLTGVRKQLPLTPEFLAQRIKHAKTVHNQPGPAVAQALTHLSAMAPRAGDPELLSEVVQAFAKCVRVDQVPQVQRALTSSLTHLATNLADVRPLAPLISVACALIEQGGDEAARVQAVHFLGELYAKERRVAQKSKLVRTFLLFLQSGSDRVQLTVLEFFRTNLEDTIHALTVAFCNRDRATWERITNDGAGRVVGGRTRNTSGGWSTIRLRILQLLLEEDRLLPEMLDWIFSHDGSATQKIAIEFIDPGKTTRIADRILRNLRSRKKGVQDTAIHFVGSHRMEQAISPLIELLLSPYATGNRSLIEWSLDAIGQPALDEVINRLGGDTAYEEFVRRMFNRHDRSTDSDFNRMQERLKVQYGETFDIEDITQTALLSHYLGEPDLRSASKLSRWNKRRAIVFYDLLSDLYLERFSVDKIFELLDETDPDTRPYFVRMAIQKNLFENPNLLALVAHENSKFLENFVRLENQIPQQVILNRLREFTAGLQLDMSDPQDTEIYYLYLLKQSPRMPDRSDYLKHIREAQMLLFPPVKDYCKAFSIAGDRIEEVGTVDRDRIRNLVQTLPGKADRKDRLRRLILEFGFPKKQKNRLINGLAEAIGIDVTSQSTIEDRTAALLDGIDFEFDSAYRPVPQVVFPILLRIRMKHRDDSVFGPLAEYALEFAMINNPEIPESFDSGEVDLVLDSLNDLLTDRVFEAERELSDDVFPELLDKHKQAWAQFYEAQWKGIIKRLRPHAKDDREKELVDQTEETMLEYDTSDDESTAQLDTNLTRLVSVILPTDRDLITYHARHRECYKIYDAVLRVRNLRQLKRIYREVNLILQDEISYAGREHTEVKAAPMLPDGNEAERRRSAISKEPGYLKYARKELGKIGKLSADFVLERALADRVSTVRSEITKLRQIVVGTSQILCVPSKDVSIIYRSWPGNDCNTGDMKQIMNPDCSFYKILSAGVWKGYFTIVELRNRGDRAFLLDVLNFSGLKMDNDGFVKVLMHQIIQIAKSEDIKYVLISSSPSHISNRDYIRGAVEKVFPNLGTVQGYGLPSQPSAYFQSLQANLNVIWKNEEIED
jgi:hypothetical protein